MASDKCTFSRYLTPVARRTKPISRPTISESLRMRNPIKPASVAAVIDVDDTNIEPATSSASQITPDTNSTSHATSITDLIPQTTQTEQQMTQTNINCVITSAMNAYDQLLNTPQNIDNSIITPVYIGKDGENRIYVVFLRNNICKIEYIGSKIPRSTDLFALTPHGYFLIESKNHLTRGKISEKDIEKFQRDTTHCQSPLALFVSLGRDTIDTIVNKKIYASIGGYDTSVKSIFVYLIVPTDDEISDTGRICVLIIDMLSRRSSRPSMREHIIDRLIRLTQEINVYDNVQDALRVTKIAKHELDDYFANQRYVASPAYYSERILIFDTISSDDEIYEKRKEHYINNLKNKIEKSKERKHRNRPT